MSLREIQQEYLNKLTPENSQLSNTQSQSSHNKTRRNTATTRSRSIRSLNNNTRKRKSVFDTIIQKVNKKIKIYDEILENEYKKPDYIDTVNKKTFVGIHNFIQNTLQNIHKVCKFKNVVDCKMSISLIREKFNKLNLSNERLLKYIKRNKKVISMYSILQIITEMQIDLSHLDEKFAEIIKKNMFIQHKSI